MASESYVSSVWATESEMLSELATSAIFCRTRTESSSSVARPRPCMQSFAELEPITATYYVFVDEP